MSISINILIPVYNAGKYLERCLDSIYSQIKGTLHEIILVDDGSTDDSGIICDAYKEKYPLNTAVYHKQNEGVSPTRNFLLDHATKDYIWFVDADDVLQSDAVDAIVCKIEENNKPEVVTLGYKQFNNDGYAELRNVSQGVEAVVSGVQCLQMWQPRLYLWCNVCNLDFLRSCSVQFNTSLSVLEDALFNMEVFLQSKSILCSKVYAYNYYVGNPSSAMSNPAYRLRNAEHSFLAIEHIKSLLSRFNGAEEQAILENYLAHTVIGFVYSFYLGNFEVSIVRQLIKRLMKLQLYPMKKCKNKHANRFLLLGNRYHLFCFACWIKNKMHPDTIVFDCKSCT